MSKVHIPDIEEYRDLSNLEGIIFTFFTERGRQDMGYAAYLKDVELRSWINNVDRYKLVIGRTLFCYTMKFLKDPAHNDTLQACRKLEQEKMANPLRFFAPSGHEMTAFINDLENNLCILTAPNRTGKTQSMLIKELINAMPCDPSWEIFTKYGVNYVPFRGPKTVGLSTYDFGFHRDTTLPMLLAWIPEKELGVYSKNYKGKGAKQVNLNNTPILPIDCGTNFILVAMSQGQEPYEGNTKHNWGWDEQGGEPQFDGADERTRTVKGRHDFALTPHKVDGRPDTGAGSWINKVYGGDMTKGKRVGRYKATIFDVPDWIYPEDEKVASFYKWVVEPTSDQDDKKLREGQARFFGNWHESSGLVIDEWDSRVHIIEPFEIPKHWTIYRAVDHGDKHPAACLWGAVSPAGDLFIFRDFLRKGLVPSQIAREIIELSGNKRKLVGSYTNHKNELRYNKYEEVFISERPQWTMFDARSFSKKEDGIPISQLYSMSGLKMRQGSGHNSETYVPIIKEWFVVDKEKKHFVTGEMGAPRIYVFNTCSDFIKTIKRWIWVERKTKGVDRLAKESPTKVDDDLCDAMKLMIQGNPSFRGNALASDRDYYKDMEEGGRDALRTNRVVDSLSGY